MIRKIASEPFQPSYIEFGNSAARDRAVSLVVTLAAALIIFAFFV